MISSNETLAELVNLLDLTILEMSKHKLYAYGKFIEIVDFNTAYTFLMKAFEANESPTATMTKYYDEHGVVKGYIVFNMYTILAKMEKV